jgi:hypothetical protein
MSSRPHLEQRDAMRYVAIAGSGTGESAFRAFADRSFPAVFGAVGQLGLAPTGAPFFRLFRFVPGGAFEVEVGVPVAREAADPAATPASGTGVPGADRGDGPGDAYLTELPAGRYVVHVHEGAYSADDETWAGRDLASAHRRMETWAAEQGLRWATQDDSGRFAAVIEQYLVGPAESSDVASWRTSIAKLVAD